MIGNTLLTVLLLLYTEIVEKKGINIKFVESHCGRLTSEKSSIKLPLWST